MTQPLSDKMRRHEYAMLVSQLDACIVLRNPGDRDVNWHRGICFFKPSDHDYYYAAGIGDAWSVKVKTDHPTFYSTFLGDEPFDTYRSGNVYHYGLLPPHYPVPMIPIEIEYDCYGIEDVASEATIYLDMWIGHDPCIHREWCNR